MQLRSHINKELGGEKGTQGEDGVSFSTHSNLQQGLPKVEELLTYQQNTQLNRTHYVCFKCKKPFSGKHPRTRVGVKPHQCTECEKSFWAKQNLIIHLRIHSGERPFQCTYCKKSFRTKNYLTIHLRIHTGERPFHCTECRKGFIDKGLLNRHMRIHLGHKPYHCTRCSKRFTRRPHLKKHQSVHKETSTNGSRERYDQSIERDQNFNMQSEFNEHQTHSGENQKQCAESEKSLRQSNGQSTQLITWEGEQPYQCTACEESFRLKSSLTVHLRIHSGKRVFQCPECQKSFSTKGYLAVHLRRHAGAFTFQCTECKKGFYQKGELNAHQRIHLGERPYNCTICGKDFIRKANLKRHERVHTQTSTVTSREGLCQCTKRDKNVSVQSAFNKHQKTNTGERQTQYTEGDKSLRPIDDQIRHHRTCIESEKSFVPNTHIIQQRKHTGEITKKTHMIMVRLLEVSIPNDYFVVQRGEDKDVQIIEDTIKEM